MTKRPLVPSTIRTEFGDVLDDPAFYDVGGADRDLTYVPGFSDMRRTRDLEVAAVASGRKLAHQANIMPLPVNLRWVRHTSPKGAPDGRKQIGSGNLGYRTVDKASIGKEAWLTALPPGATISADGSIVKGDTMLMVTDGKTAGRNAARRTAQTQRLISDVAGATQGLLNVGSRKQGSEPFIRQEV